MIIKIWYRSELVSEEAGPTPTPGLVINRDPGEPDVWNVTHLRSGTAVAKLPDPESALHIAIRLGPVCDWTMDALDIRASQPIRRGWVRVLREEGAAAFTLDHADQAVPAALLAGMEGAS